MSQPLQRALGVTRLAISDLRPDPANARLHPETNLDSIKASLTRFGQAEPLVIQSGTHRIIAGHGRLMAMKALGWKEVDVIELDIDDLGATSLGIALNRTAELAEWDEVTLGRLLSELRDAGAIDGVGYTNDEIDTLLAEINVGKDEVNDEGPEEPPAKPATRLGDLWILGNHRLLCGSSTKPEDISRVLNGDVADLLSTDPPYCVSYTGNDRPIHNGKSSGKDWSDLYREVDIDDLGTFLDGVMVACLPHVKPTAPVYMWHAHVQQPTIAAVFERHGILLHQVLVWVKPTATFGHSFYRWRHEPCAFGWQKGHKPAHGFGQLDSIWEADWDGKARIATFHPTSKPPKLFEIPMEQHTAAGGVVLEPFSGSGSQIIAAERLGRRCRAVELQPAFVDGTILRWQKATGKQAVHAISGKTFDQASAEAGVTEAASEGSGS